MRFGIVYRMTLLFSLLVLAMALTMYWGVELRGQRVRETQRHEHVRFLARSMALGILNFTVTRDTINIGRIINEVLNKNMNPEIVITRCLVTDKQGGALFLYKDPLPATARAGQPGYSVREKITATDRKTGARAIMGHISIDYVTRDAPESDKMRHIITIGNTIGAMFQVFYRSKTLFQAKELVNTVRQDPNIVYCAILGKNNAVHFQYPENGSAQERRIPAAKRARALAVSHANPLVIQDVAYTPKLGRVIEVSMLIEEGDQKLAVVRLGYSLKTWSEKVSKTRRNATRVIIGLTLLAMLVSVYFSQGVSRPIRKLMSLASDVTRKAPGHEISPAEAEKEMERIAADFEALASRLRTRRDEVGDLAESFSLMITHLHARILEVRRFYRKMGQTDRLFALGQLSAGIAHEINNPLAIISTYVQIIARRKNLDGELKKEINIMAGEIERIAGKVRELMSMAQDAPMDPRAFDLHALIRNALSLVRHQFSKKNIEIVEDFHGGGAPLLARIDENRFKQVILNLALNAMQAMEATAGGTLTFGTSVDERHVRLVVADTGCGIPEEDLPRLYDPFFTRRPTGQGTGLGLAITYNIVQSHGGDIEAANRPEGGAVFTITLPKDDKGLGSGV